MEAKLKPIDQQVIVITGASSGIGLATALIAAQQGAKVVLAARSSYTLAAVAEQIEATGGHALAVPADVSDRVEMQGVADAAMTQFGRVDTWVNNAGVSMYGRLDEVPEADSRRLFDVNFWGVVHGSLIALPLLKANPGGGALINVGSEVSEAALPLQGMYAASKHAVKGFTDALRIELEVDKAPISVTLIQPGATDTPFPEHAANYMAQAPKLPTPMMNTEKVAMAILDAAHDPTRSVRVGATSVINTALAKLVPGLGDRLAAKQIGRQQRQEGAIDGARHGTLYVAGESGEIKGVGDANAANPAQARASNTRPPT